MQQSTQVTGGEEVHLDARPLAIVDAIVWGKAGGESDGSSSPGTPSYSAVCAQADADVPAPAAGAWFQEYFNTLISKANPPL